MTGKVDFGAWRAGALLIVAPFFACALSLSAADRVQLHPQFKPGETLYYQVEMHDVSTGQTTTPIINPEGGTKFSENVDILVRLDVLASTGASLPNHGAGAVRLRVTFERAHADSQTDAPAFNAPSPGKGYDRLEGHSFELTLEPGGAITDLKDLDNILSGSSAATPALSWLRMLESGSQLPRRGIAIGEKWASETDLDSAPLTGLVWRSESNYLRNEPCKPSTAGNGPKDRVGDEGQQCAVILTRFEMLRRGSAKADRTPPDFLRHGLRTSGTLTGSGESLDSISLSLGVLVNSTQSSTQRSDYDITNAANGEKIHRTGEVQTQTVITRVAAPTGFPSVGH